MNNELSMNQEEFESVFASFEQLYNELNEKAQGITSSFAPAINSGLMPNMDKLQNQLSSIGTSISSVNATMKKQAGEMFAYDEALAKEADTLEIPTDFLKENSQKVNHFNKIILDKMDGEPVNLEDAQKSISIEEAINLEGVEKEKLQDISGNATKEVEASKIEGKATEIENIKKDSDLTQQEINVKSGVKTNLEDIKKDNEFKEKEIDNPNIAKKEINNISKDSNVNSTDLEGAINFRGQTPVNFGTPSMSSNSSVSDNNFEISKEHQEKSNILNNIMLEEEIKKEYKEKQEEKEQEEIEKVDYNDFIE